MDVKFVEVIVLEFNLCFAIRKISFNNTVMRRILLFKFLSIRSSLLE